LKIVLRINDLTDAPISSERQPQNAKSGADAPLFQLGMNPVWSGCFWVEATVSAEFCDKIKERPKGRIEMRSRDFSPVLAQMNPIQ
jgi:hypothetical protein